MYYVSCDNTKDNKSFSDFLSAVDYLREVESNNNPAIIFNGNMECIYYGKLFTTMYR